MADYGIKKYRIGASVLRRSLLEGFEVRDNMLCTAQSADGIYSAFLPGIDSAEADCLWGRFSVCCNLAQESMLTVRAFASDQNQIVRDGEVIGVDDFLLNPDISRKEKEKLFSLADGIERSSVSDLLLEGQNGRWLWIWLELVGTGENTLSDMRVYVPGDNFFHTLPQVYQENNDFLRRYLSVFSTMYNDFQERIDALPDLLDIDTAPPELLPVFASWLGIETDDVLLSSEELRKLLKAAPELLERKGTKWSIEKVVGLFVPGNVYVIERNILLPDNENSEEMYGKTPYDFTVMVGCKMDEKLRLKLKFLIDQFKPIRSRGHIVFLDERGGLDSFTYLDVNSAMEQNLPGVLDNGKTLTGTTYLK